ncbi:low molecular weight protein-tyrosine-phosphatase [Rarobacter incanus]
MAESILRAALDSAGIADRARVDSTAITSEEVGNRIDPRAARELKAAGYDPLPRHRARRIRASDIQSSDLILPMTSGHARYLRRLAGSLEADIRMLRTFDPSSGATPQAAPADRPEWDIADPWYGGPTDFTYTRREIEAAAPGVVDYVADLLGEGIAR